MQILALMALAFVAGLIAANLRINALIFLPLLVLIMLVTLLMEFSLKGAAIGVGVFVVSQAGYFSGLFMNRDKSERSDSPRLRK